MPQINKANNPHYMELEIHIKAKESNRIELDHICKHCIHCIQPADAGAYGKVQAYRPDLTDKQIAESNSKMMGTEYPLLWK